MAKCELSGKGPVVKNLVSHSNIKTKSRAYPNVQKKKIHSQTLNEMVSLYVATSTLRSMEHMGGFDKYILNQSEENLSHRALEIKKKLRRKLSQPSKKKA